jgi:hypothetical protein
MPILKCIYTKLSPSSADPIGISSADPKLIQFGSVELARGQAKKEVQVLPGVLVTPWYWSRYS